MQVLLWQSLNECGKEDSNLHDPRGHQALNLARLPIPPLPRILSLHRPDLISKAPFSGAIHGAVWMF